MNQMESFRNPKRLAWRDCSPLVTEGEMMVEGDNLAGDELHTSFRKTVDVILAAGGVIVVVASVGKVKKQ